MKNVIFGQINEFEQNQKFDAVEVVSEYANSQLKEILKRRYQNTVLEYDGDKPNEAPDFDKSLKEHFERISTGEPQPTINRQSCLCYFFGATIKGIPDENTIKKFTDVLNDFAARDMIHFGHLGIYIFRDHTTFMPWPNYIIWAGLFSKIRMHNHESLVAEFGKWFIAENEYPSMRLNNYNNLFGK